MISDSVASAFGRIRSGESKGEVRERDWETVYRAVWPILVARASRHGPPQFAVDATQSALLSLLSNPDLIAGFSTIVDFVSYASRVAINRAVDQTRRILRDNSLNVAAERELTGVRGSEIDPLLLYAPKHLSSEELDLMRMFYIEGRSYGEIARVCGATERIIKTRMSRLQDDLKRLRS